MRMNWLQGILPRYALAIVSTAVAIVLTRFLRGIADSGISPLFFGAVLLSAWYGGLGPGLTATALASAGTGYLLLKGHTVSFSAIRDHLMRVIIFGVVSILASSLQDALKRAAAASQRAREAAEMASQAKSRFLAIVSHELRTPLSPVLMIADLLERNSNLPAQLREDVRCIRRNVDLELRLIDDLLDLTRISTGKMLMKEEIFEVVEPLKAAVAVCQEDLRDKQIELNVTNSAPDSRIAGDPIRLQQVFWNLIRNAVKFTPQGGRVSITLRNRTAEQVAVEITDTGLGIDPQRLSNIFEAFEQGGREIQTRFGGLGLGLAICQALVEAHHGTIAAASPGKGRGATFTVELPIVASQAHEGGQPTSQPHQMQVLTDLKNDPA